ncbi:MAG: aspartate/glutamate racemase family protein [Chloroflexota bacterium]
MTKIAAIHTVVPTIGLVGSLLKELAPEVEVLNLLDDGAIRDAVAAGRIVPHISRRMCNLFLSAEAAGAQAILLCCSTVGETADTGRALTTVPIVRIDEAMAEQAVSTGERVGVVASVSSTLGPTSRLIARKAAEAGRKVHIQTALADGALEVLQSGDAARHDAMVKATVAGLAEQVDVVVLAQASLSRVLPLLRDLRVPVLSSPRMGVERVLSLLQA